MLLLASTFLVATVGSALGAVPEERIFGPDRYATSAEIAWRAYSGGTPVVVIATGENWPDALAAGPLAGKVGGPILLTRRTSLPSVVATRIVALGATHAYIVGGSGAVDPAVESQLHAAGILPANITRLGGTDRYETAQLIAERIEMHDMDDVDTAYFATGSNFPDALAAGPFGTAYSRPILLVRRDSIPQATQDAITGLGLTKSYVLGGTAVISDAVMAQLPMAERLGGADRYETARLVAQAAWDGSASRDDHLYVVTGEDFPDALSASVLAAAGPFPIIPVRKSVVPAPSEQYINEHSLSITNLFVIGGTGVVSDATKNYIQSLLP